MIAIIIIIIIIIVGDRHPLYTHFTTLSTYRAFSHSV